MYSVVYISGNLECHTFCKLNVNLKCANIENLSKLKAEGGRRKEEGGRRKEEGGRRKEERKEEEKEEEVVV